MARSLLQGYSHGVVQEGKVCLNHVFWHVGTEYRDVGIGAKTSQKLEGEIISRDESVDIALTEHVNSYSILHNVLFSILAQVLKDYPILPVHEKGLEMLNLSGTKEEPVFAEDTLRVLSINSQDHITNVLVSSPCVRVTKLDILEAQAISESKLRVLMAQYSGLYRHEVHAIIGIDGSSPVIAAVYGPLLDPFLVNLELRDVILNHAGLPLVVLPEGLLTRVNRFDHATFLAIFCGFQMSKPIAGQIFAREMQFIRDELQGSAKVQQGDC